MHAAQQGEYQKQQQHASRDHLLEIAAVPVEEAQQRAAVGLYNFNAVDPLRVKAPGFNP
jgi:hypothetical protein